MDHQPIGARHALSRYLPLCLALTAAPLWAGNTAFELNAGVGQSDNVTRVENDPVDDTIVAAGLKFSYDERSKRFDIDTVGNLAYNTYLDDTYDSELLGNLAANVRASIVPETFYWVLSDNFGQVLNDPFTPATPDNLENINYLSTGPEAQFMFGTQTRLNLGARYALADYEDSPLDSDSVTGEAGLSRAISKGSSLGVFLRHHELDYDLEQAASDYDQSQAFLRYDAQGARTRLRIDAGHDEINRDDVSGSQGGLLLRLEAERRVSSRSTVTLRAGREFDSSASAFANEQSGGGIDLGGSASRQTFEPFLNESFQLDWGFAGTRTDVSLGARWSRQSYDDQPEFDQTLTSFAGSVRRALTPMLSLRIDLSQAQSEFEQPGADYDDLTAGVSLEWRMSRTLITRLTYSRGGRNSDSVQGDYTENRIWLSIGYGRGTPRERMRATEFPVDAAAGAE